MKRNTVLAIGFSTAVTLGAAISSPVLADANNGPHGNMAGGQTGMMQGASGGADHGGQTGMMGGQGMMQMMMEMHSRMMTGKMAAMGDMSAFDADGNGAVSRQEALAGLAAKLSEYDADGDGSLSIAEYELLHSAAIREQMVDRFQALDNDGDGMVTSEEMAAPAARMGQGAGGNSGTAMHGQNN